MGLGERGEGGGQSHCWPCLSQARTHQGANPAVSQLSDPIHAGAPTTWLPTRTAGRWWRKSCFPGAGWMPALLIRSPRSTFCPCQRRRRPRAGGGEGNRPWEDAAAQGHPWVHSMPWPSASGTGAERGRSRQTAARRLWAAGEGLWSRGCRAGDASSVPGGIFSPSGTGGLVKPSLWLSKEALRLLQEELLERWLQGEAEHRGCASASNITMKHLHPCPEGRRREVWVRVHGAPVGPAWQRWHGVQL